MLIQTTVAGSYPPPEWLRAHPSRPALRDAQLVVIRTQELAGIDVVSDGELSRFDISHPEANGMIEYFVSRMEGVKTSLGLSERTLFAEDPGLAYRTQPAGIVTGPVGPGSLDLPESARPLRDLASTRTKVTVTSPYMLAKVLVDRHYASRQELCMAISAMLREQVSSIQADVIQVDEANLTGHPEDNDWAIEAINHVLDGVQVERAVHMCFGNYGGQTIQKGDYEQMLPVLNALHTDHLILEAARREQRDLDALQDLDPKIGLGLGVIDIKDNAIETAEEVAQRIEQASQRVADNQLQYVNPDCGFWMEPRSIADAKMRALVAGRNLFLDIK